MKKLVSLILVCFLSVSIATSAFAQIVTTKTAIFNNKSIKTKTNIRVDLVKNQVKSAMIDPKDAPLLGLKINKSTDLTKTHVVTWDAKSKKIIVKNKPAVKKMVSASKPAVKPQEEVVITLDDIKLPPIGSSNKKRGDINFNTELQNLLPAEEVPTTESNIKWNTELGTQMKTIASVLTVNGETVVRVEYEARPSIFNKTHIAFEHPHTKELIPVTEEITSNPYDVYPERMGLEELMYRVFVWHSHTETGEASEKMIAYLLMSK